MPIWLRKFTFNKMNDWYKQSNESSRADGTEKLIDSDGNVNKEAFKKLTGPVDPKTYTKPRK